ncbi:MAG TPA: nucleotide kinase domain-containing protein [Thermoanaerobaculia bacterium]|nr:nucleotide kinase domain-containing protein [Thermoanaerobaculia bacterium]
MAKKKSHGGRLIVFEGPDGVGKSTLSAALAEELRGRSRGVELMTFPGKEPGSVGKLVYDVHHEPDRFGVGKLAPVSLQALHIAAHLDAIERRILPALQAGVDVVLDRYWWSTWVYGVVAGIDRRVLEALIEVERTCWGKVKPEAVFLIRRETPIDRSDAMPFWLALCREYDSLAGREEGRYPVFTIDNSATVTEALGAIRGKLAAAKTAGGPWARTPHRPQGGRGLFENGESEDGAGAGPLILTHLLPVRPTVVFDTYWKFAAQRQRVFFKRIEGEPPPWTEDAVLVRYKFTNAYRASDRVSQYLIRSVIYRDDLPRSADEVFFRVMLFKLFNKIETWQLLEKELGPLTYETYSFKAYDRLLTRAMTRGESIYSAAYIMPSGGTLLGHDRKHRNHLVLIERMMTGRLPERIAEAPSMQRAFEFLRGYPTIGDFLAYQFVTDLNYSELTNFTEMEFVVPGPGALDGIRKCFADAGGLNEPELIRFVADRQEREFERLGLDFRSLWGRRLQLIDCQNLFCEVDKYARVRHPDIVGVSRRTRIKQKYSRHPLPIAYWYPPKWGLNDRIVQPQAGPAADRRNAQAQPEGS